MNSTEFPSPSTIACSFAFSPPLVRPIALSVVFPPAVGTFVDFDAGRFQTQVFHIRIYGQCARYGFQCTIVPPFGESGIHRLPRTIRLWPYPPLRSAMGDPEHLIQNPPVIFPWTAPFLRPLWQKQFPRAFPLFFCQFIPFHIPIFALINDLCSLFVSCPLLSISCRGGCYRPNLKSSKQVVHLRGRLLKVQIYQPFSRTGRVLPWQTNRILPSLTHSEALFLSI